MSDKEALDAMVEVMSAREWSPQTLEDLADLIRRTGRNVEDYEEEEGEDWEAGMTEPERKDLRETLDRGYF